MNYDTLAHVIKLGGTVAFFGIFVLSIIYALWPKNKARFDHAASLPLNDSDTPEF